MNVDPHISVAGHTIDIGATISGKVRSGNPGYPDSGIYLYQLTVNGQGSVGNNPGGDSPCNASSPLVRDTQTEPVAHVRATSPKTVVQFLVTYCGGGGNNESTTVTRIVTVGSAQPSAPSQPPTPSPTTTHLGLTG